MKKILIVYHTQGGNTEKIAKSFKSGVSGVKGVKAVLKKALKVSLRDLLSSDGYVFGTPDYFSYMAGALKDFFDRTCYPSEGKIDQRPYIAFVSHGGGGDAVKSLERMGRRFNLKRFSKPLLIEGRPSKKALGKACKLGKKLAEYIRDDNR
ncbi:MAG: NAD(P)H-dependent oxidoreductase [Candidatus Omnitrophica bacterium]|nr:NAD(P)H-dependent oxidoreductase [Candidatus Omnitrophota bacterium]